MLLLVLFTGSVFAQTSTGTLRGQVSDPSGAVVAEAMVSATSDGGQTVTAVTNRQGSYELKGLAPGNYSVATSAKGFALYEKQDVTVNAGQMVTLNIALAIEVAQEKVEVQDQATKVDVDPSSNASAVVLKGKDLDALSDDPDELQADLEALAGPAAGPNGGQIFIDGFSNGQLPPKSAIREIRVNQNPFSPEFDRPGFGRVEVFTKPGMDAFHGSAFFQFNSSVLNAWNPFLQETNPPGYNTEQYNANISGPVTKKSSFFLNAERRNINDVAIVTAYTALDPNLTPILFSQALAHPVTRTSITARLDYQVTKDNTLTVRYHFTESNSVNDGIRNFSLATQGVNSSSNWQSVQVSDTQTINTTTINETRFQYSRSRSEAVAQTFAPTIAVTSAFTGGGNSSGYSADHSDRFEVQNLTMKSVGTHFIKFGGRLRTVRDANENTSNYNGTYTFDSLIAYDLTQQAMQQPGWSDASVRATCVADPTDPTRQICGGASKFSIITGQTAASISQVDAGLFISDDWRLRPNFTLSYGLRYETQNNISDHADLAPRVALAWGIGKGKTTPKTVLRAGWGMFYDRFSENTVMLVQRTNELQQYLTVTSPGFYPNVPQDLSGLAGAAASPTVYQINSNLRAPYMMQSAAAVERQLTKAATLALTYVNTRGVHNIVTRDINAPLPGTFDPTNPSSGVRPLGGSNNVYQYQSAGTFKQNQLITNLRITAGAKLSLMTFYVLNYAHSTVGSGSNPFDPYDVSADFGRAGFDVRHRFNVIGTWSLPHGFRISPSVMASSGRPFNITLGQDLNGDNLYSERPAFATASTLPNNLRVTPWGSFDIAPAPGATIIPVNYATGPGMFTANLRVSKTFSFGRKGEENPRASGPGGMHGPGGDHGPGDRGGDHGPRGGFGGGFGGRGMGGVGGGAGAGNRYNVTVSLNARNLFNNVNLDSPIGNLSAGKSFGQSNNIQSFGGGASSNRKVEMQVMFSF